MKFRSPLLLYALILTLIGVFFIAVSSQTEANSILTDQFFFLRQQLIWLGVGLITFFIAAKIKLGWLQKFSFPLYLLTNLLLLLVLIPSLGTQALGAKRWLSLGQLSIQPSEIAKITMIIFFATIFTDEQKRNLKTLLFYLLPPFILIILEPNLSTAVLISAICLVIYYLSGASFQSIVAFSCLSLVIFSLLTFLAPYRFARLKTFLKPEDNSSTATYHRNQIIYALASGGIRGKGLANSDQKYKYLPKISTDSILAIIGEETGFIGLSLLFYIYLLLIGYLFRLAGQTTNPFSSLLIGGIGSWIAMQTLINAGAIANIIPLTGIPLPFISYGGSSLVTLFFSLGLVHNIEKNDNNLIYSKHGPNAGHYRYSSYSRLRTHRTASGR